VVALGGLGVLCSGVDLLCSGSGGGGVTCGGGVL
jgi:hypothetical protein